MWIKSITRLFAFATLSTIYSPLAFAAREITTMNAPEVFLARQNVASVPSEVPLSFHTNTVGALHMLTHNLTFLFKHFAVVLGAVVILASLFQYFRYRENPMAMRMSYVASTFFCGVILIGISLLETASL